MTKSKFKKLQNLFFSKICKQPNTIKLYAFDVINEGDYYSFIGESAVVEKDPLILRAFYVKTDNENIRADLGLAEDIALIVYISPLDLERQTGDKNFTVNIDKLLNVRAEFINIDYRVKKINKIEPVTIDGDFLHLAYELQLSSYDKYKNT